MAVMHETPPTKAAIICFILTSTYALTLERCHRYYLLGTFIRTDHPLIIDHRRISMREVCLAHRLHDVPYLDRAVVRASDQPLCRSAAVNTLVDRQHVLSYSKKAFSRTLLPALSLSCPPVRDDCRGLTCYMPQSLTEFIIRTVPSSRVTAM